MSQPKQIYLPPPKPKGMMSLEEAVSRRRSIRYFTSQTISQAELSQLLWATQGASNASWGYRTVPSAGATYPLEIFIVCGADGIEGLGAGIYHYNVGRHSLALQHEGDVRLQLARAALAQEFVYEAPLNVIICAVYERTAMRYGDRGERYVHMEVGHAGQNLYLQATALGLATVAVGAFHDERVREVLKLEKQYRPLYIMPIGTPVR